jgi:DNA-binding transcriptional MerR regulator
MARECGLTVSALRFYDSVGLLVPARVDPRSNYRWYADDQVVTARLLARLRRVGMPLADIARVLENRADRSVVDAVLQAHLTRLEDGLADARRELSAARSLLAQESPMTTRFQLSVAADDLRAALRSVRYAISTDPELPMLQGVLLDVDDDAVRVVATDRYRLAVSALPGAELTGPSGSVLLPVTLVDELLAALDEVSTATVQIDGDDVIVDVGERSVRGRRLDAEFPDYRRLLGTESAHRIAVDAEELRSRLAAAPTRTVPTGPDGAEQTATVLTLGPVEIGLNREFLLEALDAGGAGQLVLELDGPITPLAIRVPDRVDDISLLMPVRLT